MFSITDQPIITAPLVDLLQDTKAGALATFAGWVRDHHEGQSVTSLEYQIYPELALYEGEQIMLEALAKFPLHRAIAVHRSGHLQVGETAVWVGTSASHRRSAFDATQYIIDQIKIRLPIWKKEHYLHCPAQWVYCAHHHYGGFHDEMVQ